MKFKKYLINEASSNSFKIERKAYMKDYPEMLKWILYSKGEDFKTNYKLIEDIAWKEANDLRKKKIVSFHDDDFDVNSIQGSGSMTYEASVKLRSYSVDKLKSALKILKFKFRN